MGWIPRKLAMPDESWAWRVGMRLMWIAFAIALLTALGFVLVPETHAGEVGDGDARRNKTSTAIGGERPDGTQMTIPLNQDGTPKLGYVLDRNYVVSQLHHPGTDTTSVGAVGDSTTAWASTGDLSRMWLKIHVNFKGTSAYARYVRFAVQIRAAERTGSDTLDWAPWAVRSDSVANILTTSTGPTDTLATNYRIGYIPTVSAVAAGGSANTAILPSEFVFTASSNQFYQGYLGESGKSFYIPLADYRGLYYWAPYTQIRLRVITTIGGGAVMALAASPAIDVVLLGTALR